MSLKTDIAAFEIKMTAFELKVGKKIAAAVISATKIVDKFVDVISKVDAEMPIVISDLESPLASYIASLVPGGTTDLQAIITILTRVSPFFKQIIADKTVLNGAMHHLAAEITSFLDGGVTDINIIIANVQELFIPTTTTTTA